MRAERKYRVLVVDDDVAHAEMVVQFLRLSDAWTDATIDTSQRIVVDAVRPPEAPRFAHPSHD